MNTRKPKQVRVIPPTKAKPTDAPTQSVTARRVAAYARVSTNDIDQRTSYNNQVDHYTQYIREHEGWEFAGMFTDEGITGTSIRHRDGFNAMIAAAMEGRIDLIITKSISRFARNTVDTLTTVRKLKERGVEVYFEKENIFTLDSKGELLITIMSSLAQEESRSISENVTWGMRRRFAEGMVYVPYERFLGYRKGQDGQFEIIPEEAEVVRYIYRLFMEGKSLCWIARHLTEHGIPTPTGRAKWGDNTVRNILRNEKYKGEALLQKRFRTDFLTKKNKVNEGEVPQYYVENSHPAIVSPALFDAAQEEFKQRASQGFNPTNVHCFSGKLFCAKCGGLYGSKKYMGRRGWRCNNQHSGKTDCRMPTLRDEDIEAAFVEAFNRAIDHKDKIMDICLEVMAQRCDTSGIEAEIAAVQSELAYVTGLIEQYTPTDSEVYMDYVTRRDGLQDRLATLQSQKGFLKDKFKRIQEYLGAIRTEGRISGFHKIIWLNTVSRAIVQPDGTIQIEFKEYIPS